MSRNEDRRRFVPKYPNGAWATVADVPTGAPVIDGGVLKQRRGAKRCDEGCILYADLSQKEATAEIGGNALTYSAGTSTFSTPITPYTSANDDLGNRIFSANDIYKIDNQLDLLDDTIAIEGSSSLINSNSDFTALIWAHPDSLTTGYYFGKAGVNTSLRFGLYNDPGGALKYFHFGLSVDPVTVADTTKPQRLGLRYTTSSKTMELIVNGVSVFSSVNESPVNNTLPLVLGGRHSNDTGAPSYTYKYNGRLKGFKVFNRAISDEELLADFYNPDNLYIVAGVGSSSMYGTGPASSINAWFNLIRAQAKTNGAILHNYAWGGTTFYDGMYTGYVKPSFVSTYRPPPTQTRNATRALNRCADAIIFGYASNFSKTTLNYTEGPFVYSEYLYAMQKAREFCNQNGISFICTTPQPLTDVTRTPIQFATAEAVKALSYSVDFYTDHADPTTHYLLPAYDSGDGVHQNDAGHALMATEATPFVTESHLWKII